jgi:hypothetical protein
MPRAGAISCVSLTERIVVSVHMVKTLEIALTKAADLPEAAQERLGRDLLERIDQLARLRADVQLGLAELDAGLGEELDIEDLIRELHSENGKS